MRALLLDGVLALGVALVGIGLVTGNFFTAAGAAEPSATDLAGTVAVGAIVFLGLRIARALWQRRGANIES